MLETVVPLAWQVWYRPLAGFLIRHGVPPNEVEDAMQDLFARVVEGWDRFDGVNLAGWLFSLAHYEVLTRRNERRRAALREQRLRDGQANGVRHVEPDSHDAGETLERMRQALNPVDALIYDAMGQGLSDAETVASARTHLGVDLTHAGIRNRRYRLRKELAASLVKAKNDAG